MGRSHTNEQNRMCGTMNVQGWEGEPFQVLGKNSAGEPHVTNYTITSDCSPLLWRLLQYLCNLWACPSYKQPILHTYASKHNQNSGYLRAHQKCVVTPILLLAEGFKTILTVRTCMWEHFVASDQETELWSRRSLACVNYQASQSNPGAMPAARTLPWKWP